MPERGERVVTRGGPARDLGRAAGPVSSTPTPHPHDAPTPAVDGTPPLLPADPADLARRARGGCADSFARLVTPHEGALYRFLVLRSGNGADAEELAQETLLRAWSNLHRYDAARPFAPWLFTIAHRLACSLQRHNNRRPARSGLPDDLLDPRPDPALASQRREQGGRLWSFAAQVLSEDQSTALWLRYAEDLPPAEIGRVLGRSGPAVRVLLLRARRSLARELRAATTNPGADATPPVAIPPVPSPEVSP